MRELKFRAWNGVYMDDVIGYDYNCGGINKDITLVFDKNEGVNRYRTSDLNIMQFTGLKDKNGKEIYEGDVIKVIRNHWNNCGKEHLEKIAEETGEVVFYKNLQVSLKTKEKEGTLYQPFLWIFADEEDCEIEIIGNVYENKDLLK